MVMIIMMLCAWDDDNGNDFNGDVEVDDDNDADECVDDDDGDSFNHSDLHLSHNDL